MPGCKRKSSISYYFSSQTRKCNLLMKTGSNMLLTFSLRPLPCGGSVSYNIEPFLGHENNLRRPYRLDFIQEYHVRHSLDKFHTSKQKKQVSDLLADFRNVIITLKNMTIVVLGIIERMLLLSGVVEPTTSIYNFGCKKFKKIQKLEMIRRKTSLSFKKVNRF